MAKRVAFARAAGAGRVAVCVMHALALIVALAAGTLALAGCGGDGDGGDGDGSGGGGGTGPAMTTAEPRSEPAVETVATGLDTPWELAFLPDGRALVTERSGRIRLLDDEGGLRPEPVAELDVDATAEGGLLGLAVDPRFADNRFVYAYRTTAGGNEVVRLLMRDGRLAVDRVLVDEIPSAAIHDGGRLAFSPGGDLFITTGDAGRAALAQDEDSLAGKILRLDGDAARGDGGEPAVHSRGHRNPQGLAWEPGTGRLVAPEHGADRNDEINVIEEGANYGWPETEGSDHGRFASPLRVYSDRTLAPSGATFVSADDSAWAGDLLVAALRGTQLRRLSIDGDEVTGEQVHLDDEYGRLRTVVEGPDGALYVLTSNRDGRGDPAEDDDRILRLLPPDA